MRWLVGWSIATAGTSGPVTAGATGPDGEALQPVGSQLLWSDPDPLWAVGDWRPDEVRVVTVDPHTRIAVLGTCGASDEDLRLGLLAARGGALRHLTAWSGSYTAVARIGRRVTVAGDLAGARPVFHTPGPAAPPTPPRPSRSPTWSRPTSTSAISPPSSPPPTSPRPCTTPRPTSASTACRPVTP